MTYYKLDWTTEKKTLAFIKDYDYPKGLLDQQYNGVSLKLERALFITLSNTRAKLPDILVGGALPIISQRFKNLLCNLDDFSKGYLQFFEVQFQNKAAFPSYYFLNLIDHLDAIDEENSKLTRLPKDIFPDRQHIIKSIEKLVLQEDKMNDRNIFRLKKHSTAIYVSEKLKTLCEDNKLLGLKLINTAS